MTENTNVIATHAVVALVAITCGLQQASADIVTLTSERDNTLYQSATGNVSNGAGQHFFVGTNNQGIERRGLLWFDIASSVPAGATIDAVALTLHLSNSDDSPQSLTLHRMVSDWGEGTSDAPGSEGQGAAATAGDATWLHNFYDSSFWPGMMGGDFTIEESSILEVQGVGFHTWVGNAQMRNEVAFFIDNPTENFGWMVLNRTGGPGSANRFDTRENLNVEFRPTLTIEYTIPSPPALAAFAAIMLIPGRRQRTILHDGDESS